MFLNFNALHMKYFCPGSYFAYVSTKHFLTGFFLTTGEKHGQTSWLDRQLDRLQYVTGT